MSDGEVRVPRRQLRSIRSLTAGTLAGMLLLSGAWVAKLFSDSARCEAANEFRRQDLPTAFNRYSHFLGEEFDVPEERVDEAAERFDAEMDALFPAKDCSLWSVATANESTDATTEP